ncbi:MAG: tetratricopeptide repeat protein [Pseudomonadota bacterium]|nr:tetratricopeptide repeat protein [Pseudomonadota bacterium]
MIAAAPAAASTPTVTSDPASVYVSARAASISGNHAQAAQLYARLAAGSRETALVDKAVGAAISAGNMPLALQLIRAAPQAVKSVDSKLLLVADALRRGQSGEAAAVLGASKADGDLGFWLPLVQAWDAAERRDPATAVTLLGQVPKTSALAAFVDEETALILLKLGNGAQAEPFARRAIAKAGPREYRLRLALAAGYTALGDRARAAAMIEGVESNADDLRKAAQSGELRRMQIESAAEAFSEQLVALAIEMRRSNPRGAPVNILQLARYAAPENSSALLFLGTTLNDVERTDDALAVFRAIGREDPLHPEALDAQVRTLSQAERFDEALSVASASAKARGASSEDLARVADVYSAMDRHNEAAQAYQQAIDRAEGGDWTLLLLQASALESADRWPEAKAALAQAMQIAPEQPLILNFLGYAKLERGEDLDTAEALIRKASALAPDDASITDSLGWALFKRGRTEEAIATLQRAAMGDPGQAEIHEHLGDALYSAGRRFEARFAWQAALATADEEAIARLQNKIDGGLSAATAAR